MAKAKPKSYFCPAEAATDVLGGKWKLVILWFLKERPYRFNELFREIPEISEAVLSRQLKELANEDIIARKVVSETPLKVEYSMSKYGKTLKNVITAACNWGQAHIDRKGIKLRKIRKK